MNQRTDTGERRKEKGNMTAGNPIPLMLGFAIPMILGNMFQQFYNLFDTILVGRLINAEALAAVGASTSITMLFVMFAAGAGIGCSVVISQLFGAGKIEEMKTAISTAVISILLFAVLMSVAGRLMSRDILVWMQTPDNILPQAEIYLNIYFYGFVFLFLYNMFNAVFNALGASKIPLLFLIFSSLLNIVLDWIMIRQMGIAGAAWATLISQAVSAILSFLVLVIKIGRIRSGRYDRYNWPLMKKMITIAVPSIVQQSLVSIGMLLIQAAVNTQGDVFMSGYAAAVRIDGIAIVPLVNVGNAVSTFVAQNMGARRLDRAKKGYHIGLVLAILIAAAITILLYFTAEPFVGVFMNEGKDVAKSIYYGAQYIKVVSLFYFLFGIMNVTGAVLRGSGDMKWFLAQTIVNLFVRIFITYAFIGPVGGLIIMIAMPVSWTCSALVSFIRYRSGKWTEKQLV